MKKLFYFHADVRGNDVLEGYFISTEEAVSKLYDKYVYFGEVLGKYSDVEGTLREANFRIVTEEQDFIQKYKELDLECGINPFNFIDEEDWFDEEEEDNIIFIN